MKHSLLIFSLLLAILSCEREPKETVVHFNNPANALGSEPNLHKSEDGTIYLSWIEAVKGENSKLLFSTLNESNLSWSNPILIAEGSDWFVNWADFPSLTAFGKNNLAAHYLDKSAEDTYAYDVKLTISNDKGKTWTKTIIPHKDGTNTEHGFVSKVAINDTKVLTIWLDGRQYAYAEKDTTLPKQMSLRSAIISEKGEITQEAKLDHRVCDCCQTDVAMTQEGPIAVYRDRSNGEIRDIYYVRNINGNWTSPKPIYNDGWSIFGCPVNGPAISARDNLVAVAWFSAANDTSEVKVAFSNNNGETFLNPFLVEQVKPSGRVDVELLNDNSALISWMDTIGDKTVIQLQRIYQDGGMSPVITVSESSESRSSGFPRLVLKDDMVYLAWTHTGDTLTVKTASINMKQLTKL